MQKPADCKSKRKQRGSNSVYGSLKEDNAEVAQLVEHKLAPKDKRFQPWQDECKTEQTANAKENNAEVAQLVEHNLAPKDKRFQPWQDECKTEQTANAKENNAEVAQLVEHNLAKVGVAGSSPVFRSRKKSLARMVELVDTRDLKSLGQ